MIKPVLSSIIADLPSQPGIAMYHGQKEWQNKHAEHDTFLQLNGDLQVYLDDPLMWGITNFINMEEEYYVSMIFHGKSDHENWTPQEHQMVINRARTLAREFVQICVSSPLIRSIRDVNLLEFTSEFDVCTSGVTLTCKIKPNPTEPVC